MMPFNILADPSGLGNRFTRNRRTEAGLADRSNLVEYLQNSKVSIFVEVA